MLQPSIIGSRHCDANIFFSVLKRKPARKMENRKDRYSGFFVMPCQRSRLLIIIINFFLKLLMRKDYMLTTELRKAGPA